MRILVLNSKQLAPFLRRHMQMNLVERDLRLDEFLLQALEKANEFVPSESGSIFLDDPASKEPVKRDRNQLAAVACFGKKAPALLGKKILARRGIVGRVYVSGQAYFSRDVRRDPHFSSDFDKASGHKTRSILCVPISIRDATVGVLELINKKGRAPFNEKDFELLKIFADYISASIQNFLDAKRHADIAKKDNLTGLSNDRQFHAVLKKEVTRAWRARQELGLIFLDLDQFKEINDEHGHLAGSRVLVEVAEVMRQSLRGIKAEIARYGGDEYIVILPHADLAQTVAIAENLRVSIARTVFLAHATPDVPAHHLVDHLTASVGVACLLKHVGANDRNALLRAADEAMYISKRAGKNRVSVAPLTRSKKPSEVSQ